MHVEADRERRQRRGHRASWSAPRPGKLYLDQRPRRHRRHAVKLQRWVGNDLSTASPWSPRSMGGRRRRPGRVRIDQGNLPAATWGDSQRAGSRARPSWPSATPRTSTAALPSPTASSPACSAPRPAAQRRHLYRALRHDQPRQQRRPAGRHERAHRGHQHLDARQHAGPLLRHPLLARLRVVAGFIGTNG